MDSNSLQKHQAICLNQNNIIILEDSCLSLFLNTITHATVLKSANLNLKEGYNEF